jgi:hypothetical protein
MSRYDSRAQDSLRKPAMHPWSLLIGLCIIFIPGQAFAQHPLKLTQMNHTSWTARDGAPSEINGLAEAPDGIPWIGAGSGLFRFDGNTFAPFQPHRDEPPHPGLSASTLAVAHDGTVWAGFRPTGVVSIHAGRINVYWAVEGLPAGVPKQLLEGPDGTMWAVIEKHQFRLRKGYWNKESDESIPASDRVYKRFFDSAGVQWVGTNERIYRRPTDHSIFKRRRSKGTCMAVRRVS